jgi:hypothetical protein
MNSNNLQTEIEDLVPKLLNLAKELTGNDISSNCKFILSEIKNSLGNSHVSRVLRIKENDKKKPLAFSEIMPKLLIIFDNLYDINLRIYKSRRNLTIIDIRYYTKFSLDPEYKQKVIENPPMLHCGVELPPWLTEKKEKFDINREHKQWLLNWKLFWAKRKLIRN